MAVIPSGRPRIQGRIVPRAPLQGRVIAKFPARVIGATGITITKANGVYTFSVDFSEFAQIVDLNEFDTDDLLIPIYDSDALTYRTLNVSDLVTSLAGLLDGDLLALAALTGTGIPKRTGTDTWALTAGVTDLAATTADRLFGTNGAGASGLITLPAAGLALSAGALALANDLAALEGLGSTGIAVRTASNTWAQRSIAVPAAGLSITNPAGVAGDPTLALANDLAALEALGSTGLAARTGSDAWAQRTITGTAGLITVTNGSGAAGDPTLTVADAAAYTLLVRNAGTTGAPAFAKLSSLTDRTVFGSGDKLMIEESSGELRKIDFDDLPGSTSTAREHGQCRLTKSGANLLLSPLNGNKIVIDDSQETIPDAGVTLAAPSDTVTMTIASPCAVTWTGHGLVTDRPITFATSGALPTGLTAGVVYYASVLDANTFNVKATTAGSAINTTGTQSGTHKIGTLRFIYVYMNAGTMTLEASTTTHAIQAATGIEIKSGVGTRSFVGLAFDRQSGSATAWVDSVTQRMVASWFNRQTIVARAALTADRTTTSTTFVEINSELRPEFICFAVTVNLTMCGAGYVGAVATLRTQLVLNGTAIEGYGAGTSAGAGYQFYIAISSSPTVTEGYNYGGANGDTTSNTATWVGSGTPGSERTILEARYAA